MNKLIKPLIIVCAAVMVSCGTGKEFGKDKAAYTASKVIKRYTSSGNYNDLYFAIKENNFFEFYMELFDAEKNTSYPGKYTKNGDTLVLNFYNKKGEIFLGSKALENKEKTEIVFFDKSLGKKRKLIYH